MKEFRVIDSPDQQFGAVLSGRRCTIRLRYNPTSRRWTLDLALDDQFILHGRRLVTGVDLLAPFDLGVGKLFALEDKAGVTLEPAYEELIKGLVKLYHATDAEVEEHINGTVSP